jgi:acyl transferase domain-containing protein
MREEQMLEYIQRRPYALQDLSYTLGLRRDALRFRRFLVADGISASQGHQVRHSSDSTSWAVTFLFSGQGAQWPEMGKKLLIQVESFRNDIKRMDNALQSLDDPPGWRIEGITIALLLN